MDNDTSQMFMNTNNVDDAFCEAMTAIDIAVEKGWRNLWLEVDSKVVMLAFSSSFVVPWCISNRWANCLYKTRLMNFIVSHIYREGNTCAGFIASIGLTITDTMWWDNVPLGIGHDLIRNKLGLPTIYLLTFKDWLWFGPPIYFLLFSF